MTGEDTTTRLGTPLRGHSANGASDAGDQPVSTLRGPSVGHVDGRRIGRALVAVCLLGVTIFSVVLIVAGVHRNSQVSELHDQGVKTTLTVSSCLALLGGSGSNLAGYQCRGNVTVHGRSYNEALPGATFYPNGTQLQVIMVPSDPALLNTVHAVDAEHSSATVFVLPVVLLVLVAAVTLAMVVIRRRRPAVGSEGPGDRSPHVTTPMSTTLVGSSPAPVRGDGVGGALGVGAPPTLAAAPYDHSAVVATGSLVLTAGACPLDASGAVVAPGDHGAQAKVAFTNLVLALDERGARLEHLVKTTIYVVGDHDDLMSVWKVIEESLAPLRPPSTLVGVSVLGYTHQLVEIEAIAALPGP